MKNLVIYLIPTAVKILGTYICIYRLSIDIRNYYRKGATERNNLVTLKKKLRYIF